MDNIIAKSEFLLDLFGYKVSAVSKTVRTPVFMETVSGRGEAVGSAAGSTHWKISAPSSTIGESRAYKSSAVTPVSEDKHSMDELKRQIEVCSIPSSSARRLDVCPVMEGGTEEWAKEFKKVSTARSSRCNGRNKTEASPKTETECFVEGKCTAIACKTNSDSPLIPGLDTKTDPIPSILINETFSVRLHSDLYGRRLTEIRRLYTDDDHNPLEVV
jgi:hypothetical protein